MSHISAKFTFEGDTVYEVDLPAEGKLSDSIAELRKQAGAFLTTHLAANNQSTEEVDIMEEVIEDGPPSNGGKTIKQRGGGAKRKR